MTMDNIGAQPTVERLNQLDTAVLMEKYTLLLGMINYGNKQQKVQAKKEIESLDGYIHTHVNAISFELANRRLRLTEEDLKAIEKAV